MADHTHDHSHSHDYAHSHDHAHSHDDHHHEGDTYFIDQLCMVGLSGAFGMICVCLWFWQSKMLNLMLGAQFHPYVVASGFTLVILAGIRGAILWRQSRDPAFVQAHDHHHHDHEHHHHHDHAHEHGVQEKAPLHGVSSLPLASSCGHQHAPGESCGHEHHTHDKHGHHHHDHDEADHDHGWAPWRYVVVLVPIILFLLGLPNKGPTISAAQKIDNLTTEEALYPHAHGFGDRPGNDMLSNMTPQTHMNLLLLRSIGFGADAATQLVHAGASLSAPETGKGEYVDYKVLESLAGFADRRAAWKNRAVEVRGQFAPYPGTDQIFMLARYKISCCANDAVQLNVPMIARESVRFNASEWVKVKGRVDFMEERNGAFRTVVRIAKASDVVKCDPDPNPYIQ